MKHHIAIIDPAVKRPELNAFNQMSLQSRVPLTYHLPALHGMHTFDPLPKESLGGIVVLGSLASVYQKDPWQSELSDWLMPQMESGVPTLGICYGHQLIATLLGGTVGFARSDHKKIQGCREVALSANPLWNDKPLLGFLCVSHEETVTHVPACMHIVGTSEDRKSVV